MAEKIVLHLTERHDGSVVFESGEDISGLTGECFLCTIARDRALRICSREAWTAEVEAMPQEKLRFLRPMIALTCLIELEDGTHLALPERLVEYTGARERLVLCAEEGGLYLRPAD